MTINTQTFDILESRKRQLRESIDDLLVKNNDPTQEEILIVMRELVDNMRVKTSIREYYDDVTGDFL